MSEDAYQMHNGERWCWCSVAQAAWGVVREYPVRLVGPPATDPPRVEMFAVRYGANGIVNGLVWRGE